MHDIVADWGVGMRDLGAVMRASVAVYQVRELEWLVEGVGEAAMAVAATAFVRELHALQPLHEQQLALPSFPPRVAFARQPLREQASLPRRFHRPHLPARSPCRMMTRPPPSPSGPCPSPPPSPAPAGTGGCCRLLCGVVRLHVCWLLAGCLRGAGWLSLFGMAAPSGMHCGAPLCPKPRSPHSPGPHCFPMQPGHANARHGRRHLPRAVSHGAAVWPAAEPRGRSSGRWHGGQRARAAAGPPPPQPLAVRQ